MLIFRRRLRGPGGCPLPRFCGADILLLQQKLPVFFREQPAGAFPHRTLIILLRRLVRLLCLPLLFYRLHGSNVIGMAQGEHAQRHIPCIRKPYALALAFKYSFLEGDPAASRRELISIPLATYESVFEKTACKETERRQRDTWKALQTKRLCLIEQRKPLSYLAFFLTHRAFFKDIAYFSTFEQFAIRLMIDLCAMRK